MGYQVMRLPVDNRLLISDNTEVGPEPTLGRPVNVMQCYVM